MSKTFQDALKIDIGSNYIHPEIIPVLREFIDESLPYYMNILTNASKKRARKQVREGLWTAMYMAAENHCEEAFPVYLSLFHGNSDEVNIYGECVADSLRNFLYHTYNGDLDLVDPLMLDPETDMYVKGAICEFVSQLFLDGIIPRELIVEKFRTYLEKGIETKSDTTFLLSTIGLLKFFELEDLMRQARDMGLYDNVAFGDPIERLHSNDSEAEFCQPWITLESGTDYLHKAVPPKAVVQRCREAQVEHLAKYKILPKTKPVSEPESQPEATIESKPQIRDEVWTQAKPKTKAEMPTASTLSRSSVLQRRPMMLHRTSASDFAPAIPTTGQIPPFHIRRRAVQTRITPARHTEP